MVDLVDGRAETFSVIGIAVRALVNVEKWTERMDQSVVMRILDVKLRSCYHESSAA
jgi:hypothetical protein